MNQIQNNQENIEHFLEYYKGFSLYESRFFGFFKEFLSHFSHYDKNLTLEKSYSLREGKLNFNRGGIFLGRVNVADIRHILTLLKHMSEAYAFDFAVIAQVMRDFQPCLVEENYLGLGFDYESETQFRLKLYLSSDMKKNAFTDGYLTGEEILRKYASSFILGIDIHSSCRIEKKRYYIFDEKQMKGGEEALRNFFGKEVFQMMISSKRAVFSYKEGTRMTIDFGLKENKALLEHFQKYVDFPLLQKGVDMALVKYISVGFDAENKKLSFNSLNFYYE